MPANTQEPPKALAIKHRLPRCAFLSLPCLALVFFPFLAPASFAHPDGDSPAASAPAPLSPEQTEALVRRVLRTEINAADDTNHPMQYRLRKSSPRFSTTKLIVETKDGDVARLIAINNIPLTASEQQNEDLRLQELATDPRLQRHRQEREQNDAERARKIMRALPDAFRYRYAGIVDTPQGPSYRLSFLPNHDFDPQDIEAQALKAMAGELWIDIAEQRVTRLQGKRLHDVDYAWGILGKLEEGGTLLLEQADVGNHQWRTVHLVLAMNARVLLKTIKLDTTLELSQFTPVTSGIGYQQAIQLLQVSSQQLQHPAPSGPGQ
jgi:hypothetical protein